MRQPLLIIGMILLVIAIILGFFSIGYTVTYPEGKECVNDEDCVVFGKTGDCNCGCFNKNYQWKSSGACFCAAPTSCKCIDNRCVDVFLEINSYEECAKHYPIMESYPPKCAIPGGPTFTENSCQYKKGEDIFILTISDAKSIAINSECGNRLKETYMCNNYTGTYWIDLDIDEPGCNPACVIDLETRQAEINWRCTGLIE